MFSRFDTIPETKYNKQGWLSPTERASAAKKLRAEDYVAELHFTVRQVNIWQAPTRVNFTNIPA